MKLSVDPAAHYRTKVDGDVRGPYSVEALESLVYLQKITPETLICPVGEAAYTPIKSSGLYGVLYPKAQANPAPKKDHVPVAPVQTEPASRKQYRFADAKFEKLNAAPGDNPKVEVHQILHELRYSEIKSGLDRVEPRRFQVSKRSKDFWFLLITGNGFFIGSIFLFPNPVNFVFGIAGAALFTGGLLWSMFGVMKKY